MAALATFLLTMFSAVTRPVENQQLTLTKLLINLFQSSDFKYRQYIFSMNTIKAGSELFERYVNKKKKVIDFSSSVKVCEYYFLI